MIYFHEGQGDRQTVRDERIPSGCDECSTRGLIIDNLPSKYFDESQVFTTDTILRFDVTCA